MSSDALYPGTKGVSSEPSESSDVPDLSGTVARSDPSEPSDSSESSEPSALSKLLGRFQSLAPDDSDTDNDGRTGVLSTYVEFHALIIGLFLGYIAARNGDVSVLLAVVGGAAAGSRAQLGIPEKYITQAKKELPYTIFGFGATYFTVVSDVSHGLLIF